MSASPAGHRRDLLPLALPASQDATTILVVLATSGILALLLGAVTAIAGSQNVGAVVGGGLLLVSLFLSIRFRWFSILALWLVLATVSALSLQDDSNHFFSVVGPLDALASLLFAATMVRAVRSDTAVVPSLARSPGWIILVGYTSLTFAIGYARGYQLHDILVDARVVLYLVVGYVAARVLSDAARDYRIILLIFWLTLVGFILSQVALSDSVVRNFESAGGSLASYRDIGSTFFAGKYGLILAAATVIDRRGPLRWFALALFLVGLIAVVTSLLRTDWAAAAVGILALAILVPQRGKLKLLAASATAVPAFVMAVLFVPAASLLLGAAQSRLDFLVRGAPVYADTVSIRINETQAALNGLASPVDWIFGAGLGYIFPGGTYPFQHNSVAWLVTTLGLTGTVIFLTVTVFAPLLRAFPIQRALKDPQRQVLIVCVAALLATVAAGLLSGHLTRWAYMPVTGMTVAWIEQLARPAARNIPPRPPRDASTARDGTHSPGRVGDAAE